MWLLHRTLVHVLAESTRPRRHVGQGLHHRLVGGRRKRRFHNNCYTKDFKKKKSLTNQTIEIDYNIHFYIFILLQNSELEMFIKSICKIEWPERKAFLSISCPFIVKCPWNHKGIVKWKFFFHKKFSHCT